MRIERLPRRLGSVVISKKGSITRLNNFVGKALRSDIAKAQGILCFAENYFGNDKEYGMKRGFWALAVGTALAAFGSTTMAANVSYDANLASPPGWYNGTGNPNGGFTIDNENGVEVGLRAKLRQNPGVINSPSNVYLVPAGPQTGSPTHAAWNYEFSINLQGVGLTARPPAVAKKLRQSGGSCSRKCTRWLTSASTPSMSKTASGRTRRR